MCKWPYRLTVRTQGSQLCDRSSILRRVICPLQINYRLLNFFRDFDNNIEVNYCYIAHGL